MITKIQTPPATAKPPPTAVQSKLDGSPPFFDGIPFFDGYYLVELDQPGLSSAKPYDVDFCRAKSPSDGGGREWVKWYTPNIRRWAFLPTNHPNTGAPAGSVDLLTNRKTASIVKDGDYQITGYVLTSYDGQDSCVVDRAAVRWLTSAEWWELMHPASDDPAPNNQSEPRAAQNNQHE